MSCGANGEQNGERNGDQDGEGLVSKTSVKVGCFGLAPLALVNSVYLALWRVFRCLIKLLVLKKVLSFPPLDTVAVQILHCALLLSSSFILKLAQIAVKAAQRNC